MKRKVNINRPKISSEEISKHKNFDSVIKNKPNLSSGGKSLLKKPWFLSSMVVISAAIITTAVLMNKGENKKTADIAPNNTEEHLSVITDSGQFAKPCIAPPIKGLNVDYTIYKVNAEKGGELDFKTGSKLSIPKNAFTDANGNPIKGDVELRYREFHDPIDFFVSGIPMTYDSAGTRYQFESAGMMEMLAYQDGKPVSMADGKSVNVELASDYKGTEYNLYKLDTTHNNWSCLGKDKVEKKYNKEIASGVDLDQQKPIVKVEETPEYKQLETKKVEAKVEKETEIAALPTVTPEPKKPAQAKKEKYTFNIDVDPKEYPELAVYKGLLFEVGAESTNFTKEMYDITWDAATVKEGTKKGENYQLSLQKGTKKYDIIVYPVYEGKNYEVAMKDYQTKFDSYNIALTKRKADEKRIEDAFQAKIAAIQKQQETMARQEKEKVNREFAGMTTEEKVMRTFRISSFGVYNCDNPSAYPTGVLCNAKLTNDKGTKLMIYDAYLVDKGKNGLFTYERNPVTGFSFDPKATNTLWTVENGVIYWLKSEQFSNLTGSDGVKDLKLERVDQKFKTTDELKAFFNM